MIIKSFTTRNRKLMIKMFNVYNNLCVVRSPTTQAETVELKRIQKHFTSEIEGIRLMNYQNRLKDLKLYSLERREIHRIIYT